MDDRWLVLDAEEPTEQLHRQVGAVGCEGCVLKVCGLCGVRIGCALDAEEPTEQLR